MDFVELWRIYWPSWTPMTIAAGVVFGLLLGFCLLYRTLTEKMRPIQLISAMMLYTWLYWVFSSTVFCRTQYSEYHYSLKLFWSYEFMRAYPHSYMLQEIVLNILMLLPVGVLFPVAFDCRKLWVTTVFGFILFSVFIPIAAILSPNVSFISSSLLFSFLHKIYCPIFIFE